ncbi:MAG: hypothetical protein R2712_02170 [Vicinamibacterales bacterium]
MSGHEANRPAVVIDFVRLENGGQLYVASNVGTGGALNSFALDTLENKETQIFALGALQPGIRWSFPPHCTSA